MDWKSNYTQKKPKKNLCGTSGTKVMITLVFGTIYNPGVAWWAQFLGGPLWHSAPDIYISIKAMVFWLRPNEMSWMFIVDLFMKCNT